MCSRHSLSGGFRGAGYRNPGHGSGREMLTRSLWLQCVAQMWVRKSLRLKEGISG